MTTVPDPGPVPHRARTPAVSIAVVTVLLASLLLGASASRAAETTRSTVESAIAQLVMRNRAALGLSAFGIDAALAPIARARAARIADAGKLSHAVAGDLGAQLRAAGITSNGRGEAIGYTTTPWGPDVAGALVALWKASGPHWALITSRGYNRIGVGVARTSTGATFASIVVIDSPRGAGVGATPKPKASAKPKPKTSAKPAPTRKPRATSRPMPAPKPRPAAVPAPTATPAPTPVLEVFEPGRWSADTTIDEPRGVVGGAQSGPFEGPIAAVLDIIVEIVGTLLAWLDPSRSPSQSP